MTHTNKIPDKARSRSSLLVKKLSKRLPPHGFFLLIFVLILLSLLASIDFSQKQRLFVAGEIAVTNVISDTTFVLEDKQTTKERRSLAKAMEPLVLDLLTTPISALHTQIEELFLAINSAATPEDREAIRQKISQETGEEVSLSGIAILAKPPVQKAVKDTLLPLVETRMNEGVLPETRVTLPYQGGVKIHNLQTGKMEHKTAYDVSDMKSLENELLQATNALSLPQQDKRIISQVMSGLLRPTLMPNAERTQANIQTAVDAVAPAVIRVQRGEMIVQNGEKVTLDQQMKMQTLLDKKSNRFKGKRFLGLVLGGILISIGLLFSPSGKPVTPMNNKDFIFLSGLVVLFAMISKGLASLGTELGTASVTFIPESLAYAVPIAGAAALSSLIFSARRYMVTGLLLAFFCTAMFNGGIGLFLFYLLSAMWSTWLTARTTSRQDVVWGAIPLTLGLFAMWAAATCMEGGAHTRYFSETISVLGGAFFSMLLTFALAPIVEMIFGYTTRFRLMELLNLEQPLLRDLMLTAPGTYHHSLIVSNMVEAGAKRVGAHSLLCKVAALYHDIGKVSKANYFIENQVTEDNPHNRLAPSMSALILVSHVKQGVELAEQHHLGREVTDIIGQHHGTSVIQYFYQRALNQKDTIPPRIEDYRYPGKKPQTKEAALVMLADIVEASSRTLAEPTPTRLRQHIDTILKSIYASGQLDETDMTFRDLDNLADSFQQVLRGIFHHRISYPEKNGAKSSEASPAKQEKYECPQTATVKPFTGVGFNVKEQPQPASDILDAKVIPETVDLVWNKPQPCKDEPDDSPEKSAR